MKAYWTEDAQRVVTSLSDLQATIDDVAKLNAPTMLFLERANGSILILGLGAVDSVLTYIDEDGSSSHSVGNTESGGILKFWCREQLDDFKAEMAVPEAVAVEAAHEFYWTGRRPSNVVWEADW